MKNSEQERALKTWAMIRGLAPYFANKFIIARRPLTSPICSLLIRLHFNQSHVSIFRFLIILVFGFLWIRQQFEWSIVALAAFYFMDWIDGDLSRALKHDNDLGKFEDVTIDNLLVVALPLVLIQQKMITGLLGAGYVFLITQSWWLAVIRRNLDKKSDWLLHAYAGPLQHLLRYWILPILMVLYAFRGIDWFTPVVATLCILLGAQLVYEYYQVIKNRLHNRE